MSLDVKISEFVLWREEIVCVYDAMEDNILSFEYKEWINFSLGGN